MSDSRAGQKKVKAIYAGSVKIYPNYTLEVTPSSLSFIAAGETRNLIIDCNDTFNWTLSALPTGFMASATSGIGPATVTITTTNNLSTTAHTGTVTVSGHDLTASCSLAQAAGVQTTEYSAWATNSIEMTASATTIAASGGSSTFGCKANQSRNKFMKWNGITVSTTPETQTITVSGTYSKLSGGGNLSGSTVSFGNNTTASAVSGVFRVTYDGRANDKVISQNAGVLSFDYSGWTTNYITLYASTTSIPASGGSATLSCTANRTRTKYTKWNGIVTGTNPEHETVLISPSYSKIAGSGSVSEASVTFPVNEETSGTSGVYRASYDSKSSDITIYQAANKPILWIYLVRISQASNYLYSSLIYKPDYSYSNPPYPLTAPTSTLTVNVLLYYNGPISTQMPAGQSDVPVYGDGPGELVSVSPTEDATYRYKVVIVPTGN